MSEACAEIEKALADLAEKRSETQAVLNKIESDIACLQRTRELINGTARKPRTSPSHTRAEGDGRGNGKPGGASRGASGPTKSPGPKQPSPPLTPEGARGSRIGSGAEAPGKRLSVTEAAWNILADGKVRTTKELFAEVVKLTACKNENTLQATVGQNRLFRRDRNGASRTVWSLADGAGSDAPPDTPPPESGCVGEICATFKLFASPVGLLSLHEKMEARGSDITLEQLGETLHTHPALFQATPGGKWAMKKEKK